MIKWHRVDAGNPRIQVSFDLNTLWAAHFQTMASLRFDSGPRTGQTVLIDKDKVTFGRSHSCDWVLSHPTVSREHFYVEKNNGKLFVVDQGSENGTLANGERVSWVELNDGDEIQAGPFKLVVEMLDTRNDTVELTENYVSATDEDETGARTASDQNTGMYSPQYLEGIDDFNSGRYFDAHEVWEEVWLRSSGDTKLFYQMLIQAAVGLHHYERGNSRGARGMYKNVAEKLERLPSFYLSVDLVDFSKQFKAVFAELIENDNEAALPAGKPRPRIKLLKRDTSDWSL